MTILVLNSGSTSVKFKLYDMSGGETVLSQGNCQRVGLEDSEIKYVDGAGEAHTTVTALKTHKDALDYIFRLLTQGGHRALESISMLGAAGHRVSMGGARLTRSVLLDDNVIQTIESMTDATPLHTPPQLAGIRACRELLGERFPMVAAFDTAFHQTAPPEAYMTSAPYEYYEKYSLRRFGFHGLSHQFVVGRYRELSGRPLEGSRIVTCHLGGGCSVSGVLDGKSIDNSFGFGSGEGPLSSSRAGSFDHAAINYILEKEGISFRELEDILNRRSGLLGISGISGDVRELEAAAGQGHKRAGLALEMLAYQIRKYIGSFAFAMGGLDAVIFTGGIGENSVYMRSRICSGWERLGILLDEERNESQNHTQARISRGSSPVEVWIIPTDEELLIARDTLDIVLNRGK